MTIQTLNDLATLLEQRTKINSNFAELESTKYAKPGPGIPLTDLAAAVQTSLGKADTALQSLPVATGSVLGGVKVGSGLAIDGAGVLSASGTASPNATTTTPGIVQLAGDLAGTYAAPTVPGLAGKYTKPGPGIPSSDMTSAVQVSLGKADSALQTLPVATASVLGGVKVGSGLAIDGEGTVSASGESWVSVTSNVVLTAQDAGQALSADGAASYSVTPAIGIGNFKLRQTDAGKLNIVPAAENLITNSANMTAAPWVLTSATCVATTEVTAPDGVSEVFKLSPISFGNIQISDAVTDRSPYTFQMEVRGVGQSIGKIVTLNNYNNNYSRQVSAITLTGEWQTITLSFIAANATGNNLYLGLTDTISSVDSGRFVYATMPRLYRGSNSPYVRTTGTAVNAAYRVTGNLSTRGAGDVMDVTEVSPGVFTTTTSNEKSSTGGSGFLLVRSGKSKGETIVLSAADSYKPYASDYICTGTQDQLVVSEAIRSLRGIGGTVKCRSGTFGMSAEVTFDADWVALEGEGRPFWGHWTGPWPTNSSEGLTGGTKFKFLSKGSNGIVVGKDYQQASRHQGMAIRNLYLYGNSTSGIGIFDGGSADVSEVSNCTIHNFLHGVDVKWDAPKIFNNSIQSIAGNAITHRMFFGIISGNICYDIGGSGIIVGDGGANQGGHQIGLNTIGSCGASAIVVRGPMVTVQGNGIQGIVTGQGIEVIGAFAKGVSITGNTISINNVVGSTASAASNRTGHGIYLRDGASEASITGNTINTNNTSTTAYAVALGNNSGTDTTCINNAVVGNVIRGGMWNSGGATSIIDRSGGSTNKISLNVGDSR